MTRLLSPPKCRGALCAAAAALALAAVPSGAAAAPAPVKYAGTTKEGTKITFVRRGPWLERIKTRLPMSCASAQGGTPIVRMVLWWPPFNFRLGVHATAEEKGGYTKHHTLDSRIDGRTITGKMSMNWSLFQTTPGGGVSESICQATGSFTARPVR